MGHGLASVARVAVCMGVKGTGMRTGHQGAYRVHTISLQVRIENRYAYEHCGAVREVLACSIIKIDWKIKGGWEPKVPGPLAK